MAWSNPRTWVAGAILTAAQLNTDIRDNLGYLKGLLDGTGSGTVTVPGALFVANDGNFGFALTAPGSNPLVQMDANDYLWFNRSTNIWRVAIGGADVLTVDSTGKLAGAGFYSSGEQAITASNTVTVNHGLSTRPRFVGGFFSGGTGGESGKTSPILVAYDNGWTNMVNITGVTSTQISIKNTFGATQYAHVYALL